MKIELSKAVDVLTLDNGGVVVSDEVTVELEIEAAAK